MAYRLRSEIREWDFNGARKPESMFFAKSLRKIHICNAPSLRRSFRTSQLLLDYDKAFQKFKLKQARMQCDDGLPVYLKCGLRDKILFNITLIMLLCNTVGSIYAIRDLSKRY